MAEEITLKRAKGAGRKKGKKNQKHGRCFKSPSHQRYTNEARWVKNKARNIIKQMKKFPLYKPFNLNESVKYRVDSVMG